MTVVKKILRIILIHNVFQLIDSDSSITFNIRMKDNNGLYKNLKYFMDRTNSESINMFKDLLLLNNKEFSINDMVLSHQKNSVFNVATNSNKIVFTMNESKRLEIIKLLKLGNAGKVRVYRVDRKITVG